MSIDPLILGSAAPTGDKAWQQALRANPAKVLQEVTGPFAVAISYEDGTCLLAVDRFGQQTLCYRHTAQGLRFAEHATELANDAEVDPQAIFDYLYFHCIPSPRTIFKGIFRLPPGHYAIFSAGQLQVRPYWNPHFSPMRDTNFKTAGEEFRACLEQAVASQLDGSKPACFLSGGTDSSTVAGMIRKASGHRPATYSIGFEAEGYDEMAFARLAARHFDTEHHEYYVTPDDLIRAIPTVAAHYDQPFGNSSALPTYYCALMARNDGVTRLLAGDGGDELYGGNARYAKQRVFSWYTYLPAPLRKGLLEPMLLGAASSPRASLLRKAGSYVEQAKTPMPARLQMYNLVLKLGIENVLTPTFLSQVDTQGPAGHQQQVWDAIDASATELNRTLAFDWRYTLAESDLPKVRETTRLAGVDVRFPMLDQRLLDLSLRLPDHYKLNGLKLRWFFKESLRGFLPDEILTKKKQGFGLPFGVWLTTHAGLLALARDSLATLAERNFVRAEFIDTLLGQRLQEHPGYYGEMVWILMMLEQWLRKHAPGYRFD